MSRYVTRYSLENNLTPKSLIYKNFGTLSPYGSKQKKVDKKLCVFFTFVFVAFGFDTEDGHDHDDDDNGGRG